MGSEKYTYVLRTVARDGISACGFKWPTSGFVRAPDWKPDYRCGHGLHGLLMGAGAATYLDFREPSARWLVVKVPLDCLMHGLEDMLDKCKFERGEVVFSGDCPGALAFLRSVGASPSDLVLDYDISTVDGGVADKRAEFGAAITTRPRSRASASGFGSYAIAADFESSAVANGQACGAISLKSESVAVSPSGEVPAVSLGTYSASLGAGVCNTVVALGGCSVAKATGEGSVALVSRSASKAVTSGLRSLAIATDYCSFAGATGAESWALSTSNVRAKLSTVEAMGDRSVVISAGAAARVGKRGVLVFIQTVEGLPVVRVGYAGVDIKAGKWYSLSDSGEFVERSNKSIQPSSSFGVVGIQKKADKLASAAKPKTRKKP